VIDRIGTLKPCVVTVEHIEDECAGPLALAGAHEACSARFTPRQSSSPVTIEPRCAIANVRSRGGCRFAAGDLELAENCQ